MYPLKITTEVMFKNIFDEYLPPLIFFAKNIVKDESVSDDIVQETFYKLWEKREQLEFLSVSGFLYTDVRNRCLNYLKHQKVKDRFTRHQKHSVILSDESMYSLYEAELTREVKKLIETLPKQQQSILTQSINGNSLSDIANFMDISLNTVKTHLFRARKFIREQLRHSIP